MTDAPTRISALDGAALMAPQMTDVFGPDAVDVAIATAVTLAIRAGLTQGEIAQTFGLVLAQVSAARMLQ